ncbi:MAG: hypothetical protein AB7R69_01230 [Candidatus Babeliales bacterium]
MNKKITLSLALLTSIFSSLFADQIYTPQTAVIGWELPNILLESTCPSKAGIIWEIFSDAENKWDLVKLLFNGELRKDIKELARRSDYVIDEIVEKLSDKYPALAPHANNIMDLVTEFEIINETFQVLQECKQCGYKNFIISNIGAESLRLISSKLPDFFELFDGIVVAHEQENNDDKWIAKPQSEYYKDMREELTQQGINSNIIVICIDSKKENIDALIKLSEFNMKAVRYKNPDQLRKQLTRLGVLTAAA